MKQKAALVLVITSALLAVLFPRAAYAGNFTGVVWISKQGWDYSPSHMVDQFDGNTEKMWWCGEYNGTSGKDAIYYSSIQNGAWTTPQVALTDINAPCDPTVIRGNWTYNIPGKGSTWSYIMYLDEINRPGIEVAVSNSGTPGTWTVIGTVFTSQFAQYAEMGQPVAISTNAGSGVDVVYTDEQLLNGQPMPPRYFLRYAPDGFNFGPPQEISQLGLTFHSWENPALAFTITNNYFWIGIVTHTDNNQLYGRPTGMSIYHIPVNSLGTGVWTDAADLPPGGAATYQFEPGFKTNSYGNAQQWLPYMSFAFGCTNSLTDPSDQGFNNSDICGGVPYVGVT